MAKVKVQVVKRNPGRRANVPAWLSNPDLLAPCLCGMPLMPGHHYIVGTGEVGLKRWFHIECWNIGMLDDEDDDEDYDEDWEDDEA